MYFNLLLETLAELVQNTYCIVKENTIEKSDQPLSITIDYCSYVRANRRKFSIAALKNINAYIEGTAELSLAPDQMPTEFSVLNEIISQHYRATFPPINSIPVIIQILNVIAESCGFNVVIFITFTFPKKNIFDIKISKNNGLLTKSDILKCLEKLGLALEKLQALPSANRSMHTDSIGIINSYSIDNLNIFEYKLFNIFIDHFMPSSKSDILFKQQRATNQDDLSYCMTVNGHNAIKKLFGPHTPILLFDLNMSATISKYMNSLSKQELIGNDKSVNKLTPLMQVFIHMYNLSYKEPLKLIAFLLRKTNISENVHIRKCKIHGFETYQYAVIMAMINFMTPHEKSNELKYFYIILKDCINAYLTERSKFLINEKLMLSLKNDAPQAESNDILNQPPPLVEIPAAAEIPTVTAIESKEPKNLTGDKNEKLSLLETLNKLSIYSNQTTKPPTDINTLTPEIPQTSEPESFQDKIKRQFSGKNI